MTTTALEKFPAWIEVNLDAVGENIRSLRRWLSPRVEILAVVKADAYGLGAVPIAHELEREGVRWFGVGSVAEAVELRRSSLRADIVNLYTFSPHEAKAILQHHLVQAVTSEESAHCLAGLAQRRRKKIRVHVKLDTGMHRLGILEALAGAFLKKLKRYRFLDVEGLFTTLTEVDEVDVGQVSALTRIAEEAKQIGFPIRHLHAASSGGLPQAGHHLTMVRVGILLHGFRPGGAALFDKIPIPLHPSFQLKSRLISVRAVRKGEGVGYGHLYRFPQSGRAGTVALGYYDGLSRALSNHGCVLVHGKRVPIIGRFSLNHCLVDLSEVSQAKEGDEVVLIGQQGQEEISLDEVAKRMGTVNYEVMAKLGAHVPRVYTRGGQAVLGCTVERHYLNFNCKLRIEN